MNGKRFFLLIVAMLLAAGLTAAESPGALSFLDPGARSAALGGSMVARAGTLESVHYNPAGLAHLDRFKTAFHFDIRRDDLIKPDIAVALPLSGGALFLGYNQLMLTSTAKMTNVSYLREGLSLGVEPEYRALHTLTLAGLPLAWLAVGGSLKLFHITGDAGLFEMALDLGLHAVVGKTGLTLGLAMQNIFPQINPHHSPDPLPYIFRAGAAYRVLNLFDHKVTASFDCIDAEGQPLEVGVGAEYVFQDNFLFRLGYHTYDSLPRIGAGYRNRTVDISLEFDIAFQKNEYTGSVFTFGITLGF